ncbi:MAG: GtrA family protein [Dehalococcoidia bacterium]|nr:GtrA family protein [Dehalococcoidia bacterium]
MQPELATEAETGVLAAVRELAHRLHLPTTLVKFLIVGGLGFVVNTAMLWGFYDSPIAWFLPGRDTRVDLGLFTHPDIRLLISSILAVEIAIMVQFNLNEHWTFSHRPRGGWRITRFVKYNLSSVVSPIIIVITVNVLTPILRDAAGEDSLLGILAPYVSNGIGVLVGFAWNWTINSLFIWPHMQRDEPAALE